MENLNVVELKYDELQQVEGGYLAVALSVIAIGLWVASEWDCLAEGYNEVRN